MDAIPTSRREFLAGSAQTLADYAEKKGFSVQRGVAGMPTDRFFFEGFLPPKQVARQKRIAALVAIPATLVLYESGSRLAATLDDTELAGDARMQPLLRQQAGHRQPQLGPQPEPLEEGAGLADLPLDNTPKPPSTTRRIGSPVSGCFVSGASFMLCLIS